MTVPIWPNIRRPRLDFLAHTEANVTAGLPAWVTFNMPGLDMRPAWTCLIGIVLAVLLNKCTEYYTGTEYEPVKSLAKNCQYGACHEHHSRLCRGLRKHRGGGA